MLYCSYDSPGRDCQQPGRCRPRHVFWLWQMAIRCGKRVSGFFTWWVWWFINKISGLWFYGKLYCGHGICSMFSRSGFFEDERGFLADVLKAKANEAISTSSTGFWKGW